VREGSERTGGPSGELSRAPGGRRLGLAWRTALLTTGVALLAVVVAGLLSLRLLYGASLTQARLTLDRQATLVAELYGRPRAGAALGARPAFGRLLASQRITAVRLDPSGAVIDRRGSVGPRAPALPAGDVAALVAGVRVDRVEPIGGRRVMVVGLPLASGGAAALMQPASQAREVSTPLRHRLAVGLAVGLAAAALAGVLLARWLARPLAAAARAAHRLAAGRRDVRLATSGPTELAELAEAINGLAAALEVSEARQREFLLSVSHELRTPLTAVRGFAEALADSVLPAADVPATGRVLLAEADRLGRLVSDLLDLARLGADDFRIEPGAVDLTELVRLAAQVWEARCGAEGVPLRAELPPGPVVVGTDGARLRQIIDGLAENALRVVPAGAPIVLALSVAAPWAVLQVRDGGPGLTPADCADAFERSVLYERYRGVRRVGTGVGLALVAGLTRRLGGVAEAGVAPEGGAAFTIRLPLAATAIPTAR
jgi:two-component system, OmpR family, sensor kinase